MLSEFGNRPDMPEMTTSSFGLTGFILRRNVGFSSDYVFEIFNYNFYGLGPFPFVAFVPSFFC